jgi:hypothetical protein
MTALWILPTWAGWVGLTTWGIGCGLAGWMLGRHLERGRADRVIDTAREVRQRIDAERLLSPPILPKQPTRYEIRQAAEQLPMPHGEAYCPLCDVILVGTEHDPDARIALLDHFAGPPHTDKGEIWMDARP